jgi:hypothetical protein
MPWVQLCQAQQWPSLLRLDKAHTCRRGPRGRWTDWVPCSVVGHSSGQHWFGCVRLWQEQTLETLPLVQCGMKDSEKPGSSSLTKLPEGFACKSMAGACGWSRPSRTPRVVAGTWKPA